MRLLKSFRIQRSHSDNMMVKKREIIIIHSCVARYLCNAKKDQVISDIIHERALKKIIFSITNERREELEEIQLYRNQIH